LAFNIVYTLVVLIIGIGFGVPPQCRFHMNIYLNTL